MFSYILSLMRGMNQGAGYQKVAKVKTQDVVIALAKISTCCGFRKAAQLQWVANALQSGNPVFVKIMAL